MKSIIGFLVGVLSIFHHPAAPAVNMIATSTVEVATTSISVEATTSENTAISIKPSTPLVIGMKQTELKTKIRIETTVPKTSTNNSIPTISSVNGGSEIVVLGAMNTISGQSLTGASSAYLMPTNSSDSAARSDLPLTVVDGLNAQIDLTNTVPLHCGFDYSGMDCNLALTAGQYNLYIVGPTSGLSICTNQSGCAPITSEPFPITVQVAGSSSLSQNQSVATTLPPATPAQITALMALCTASGTNCDTTLNGYNTNAIFRNNMNILLQEWQTKQQTAQTPQQQIATCEQNLRTAETAALSPMIYDGSSETLLSFNAGIAQACGDTSTATYDQAELQSDEAAQTSQQIQQLQQQVQQMQEAQQAAQEQEQMQQEQQQTEQQIQQESRPNCSLSNLIQNDMSIPGCN